MEKRGFSLPCLSPFAIFVPDMKTPAILLLTALGCLAAPGAALAQRATLAVSNPSDAQRQEIVEIPARDVYARLGLRPGQSFTVRNASGQEVDYQLTHDSLLLLDVSVRPGGTAIFRLQPGTPRAATPAVEGRRYPERLDDVAWENDRTAYRVYGPALQRTGERSFGIDVWVKNTPDLVVADRYALELGHQARIRQLQAEGKRAEAAELQRQTSYHYDHGNGLDCYQVGPTLGCGAPALLEGDSLLLPYCYRTCEILDNGPLRFAVRLDYGPFDAGTDRGVTEHRIIRCDKGSNFCRLTVWYDGLTAPRTLAAGVVVHTADTTSLACGEGYVAYADPTDNPARHNFQIYTGLLFPDAGVRTCPRLYAKPAGSVAGHAVGLVTYRPGQRFTYYFGSAWSKADVRTFAEWRQRAAETLAALRQPLQVAFR